MIAKTLLASAGLFAALAGSASAAGPQADAIDKQLDAAGGKLAENGFGTSGVGKRGQLTANGSASFPVTLAAGKQMAFVGACDLKCSDLDIQLIDADGDVVLEDKSDDDVPVLLGEPTVGGAYVVRVTMVGCSTEQCGFGIRGYVKN